jgi:hypothetical protein
MTKGEGQACNNYASLTGLREYGRDVTFRPLSAGDRPLLRQATLANMNWNTSRFTFEDVDNSDEISHYFRQFPGDRDFGVLDHEAGHVRSVAWLVVLPESNPGYGFVNAHRNCASRRSMDSEGKVLEVQCSPNSSISPSHVK